MSNPKVYAVMDCDVSPVDYLTAGKQYEVEVELLADDLFTTTSDSGTTGFYRWKGCAHLNGGNWKRVRGASMNAITPIRPLSVDAIAGAIVAHNARHSDVTGVVLLGYVTVIESAKARMDKLTALSRDWSDAESETYRNAEREVDAARLAIADAAGLTSGGLKRLAEAVL